MEDRTKELSLKNVILVTPAGAAAIFMNTMKECENPDDWNENMPQELKEALMGRDPWDIMSDHALRVMVKNAGLENVAMLLDARDFFCDDCYVCNRHFTGKAVTAAGEVDYDDGPLLAFVPDEDEGETGTLEEYRARLQPMFGDGFPYERFLADVEGT